ncbi:MAG: hypothetical protein IID53_05920 [Proteobacteria bacterium]|nr:hypothetical protein [Pseudomonadota bacterium]
MTLKGKATIGALTLGGLLAVLAVILVVTLDNPGKAAPAGNAFRLDTGDLKYPVIYAGDFVRSPVDITRIETFKPLFGPARPVVNPAPPKLVSPRELTFEVPGEYYLRFNGDWAAKILVLDADEPISEGVVRIYRFFVANSLPCNGQGPSFYRDGGEAYLKLWFNNDSPALLLCGPTEDAFRKIIEDRFRLPTRMVTFPGTFLRDGKIGKATHNIPEVYLPDKGQFVTFDINNGFFVRWLEASQIARKIHESTDDSALLTPEQWEQIGFDIDETFANALGAATADVLVKKDEDIEFTPELLSRTTRKEGWHLMSQYYYGGAAYFGRRGYGTKFLKVEHIGSLHENPDLTDAAVAWEESFGLTVKVVSPEELERLLAQGFAKEIAAEAWHERASLRLIKEPLGTRLVRAICRRLEKVWLVGSACRAEL